MENLYKTEKSTPQIAQSKETASAQNTVSLVNEQERGLGANRVKSIDTAKSTDTAKNGGVGIVLSPSEAEEYCIFKRKKRVDEVLCSLKKAVLLASKELSAAEISKCAEIAKQSQVLAVRVPPNKVSLAKSVISVGSAVDAIVGGNGETTWKVKRYEAKRAMCDGAGRITLVLSSSAVRAGKIAETKREIKKVCKCAKKRAVTVTFAENFAKTLDRGMLRKIAEHTAAYGGKYLSIPFYRGVAELRALMKDTCMLEVTGVETSADFKTLIAAGVECIGLSVSAFSKIRAELLNQAENCSFAVPAVNGSFFAETQKNEMHQGEGKAIAEKTAEKQ